MKPPNCHRHFQHNPKSQSEGIPVKPDMDSKQRQNLMNQTKREMWRMYTECLSSISEEHYKDMQKRIYKLEDIVGERESELAKLQVSEFELKKKCEELSADQAKLKQIQQELKEAQHALKNLRNRLHGVSLNKKLLKARAQDLALAEVKLERLLATRKHAMEDQAALKRELEDSYAKIIWLSHELALAEIRFDSVRDLYIKEKEKAKAPRQFDSIVRVLKWFTLAVAVPACTAFFLYRTVC